MNSTQTTTEPRETAVKMQTKGHESSTKGSLKRSRNCSIEITDEQPAKRHCWMKCHLISIPMNDGEAYEEALDSRQFYTYCPLDHTNISKAIRKRYLSRVVFGMHGNTIIERLISDKGTKITWQVPKVVVEFKRVRWRDKEQKHAYWCKTVDGQPVSPMSFPTVQQMTKFEYEAAVERGDVRIALDDQYVFEVCQDIGIGWLPYEDR